MCWRAELCEDSRRAIAGGQRDKWAPRNLMGILDRGFGELRAVAQFLSTHESVGCSTAKQFAGSSFALDSVSSFEDTAGTQTCSAEPWSPYRIIQSLIAPEHHLKLSVFIRRTTAAVAKF